jgi:hypothetical protein
MAGTTTLPELAGTDANKRREQAEQEAKVHSRRALMKFAQVTTGATLALASMPKIVELFGRKIAEKNRALELFGGTIAIASQRLEADRIGRKIVEAQHLGAAASFQMKQQSRLEEAMMPFKTAGQQIVTVITGALDQYNAIALEQLGRMTRINDLVEWLAGHAENTAKPVEQFLQQVANRPLIADMHLRPGRRRLPRRPRREELPDVELPEELGEEVGHGRPAG